MRTISNEHGSIDYLNSGDWVENLTALEMVDGVWSIFRFSDLDKKNMDASPKEEDEEELDSGKLFNNILEEFKLMKH